MKSTLHDVEVIYQTRTALAVCVRADEDSLIDVWLPLSQCEVAHKDGRTIPDLRRGEVVTLTAEQDLLEEKRLA